MYDDYVDSWGNLTLLESRLNKSIKNSEWPVKLNGAGRYHGISASNYNLNKKIRLLTKWTADLIKHRENWIVSYAQSLVGTEWVSKGKIPISEGSPPTALTE